MTNHVPTLETCQKLKETGFPQETEFGSGWWLVPSSGRTFVSDDPSYELSRYNEYLCAAPLLTEILVQCLSSIRLMAGMSYWFIGNMVYAIWYIKTATGMLTLISLSIQTPQKPSPCYGWICRRLSDAIHSRTR